MMDPNLLKNEVKIETENGALGYKRTGKALLDVSFKIPELRRAVVSDSNANTWKYFEEAFKETPEETLRFLMYMRDVRGGLGERQAFRNAIIGMAEKSKILAHYALDCMAIYEIGRWDDIIDIGFRSEFLYRQMCSMVKTQLSMDINNMQAGKPISLLAKWLPSERSKSKVTRHRCKRLAHDLGYPILEQYRKLVVSLRRYLKVLEQKTSANDWESIDYKSVPSKANLKYAKAFLKHDEKRRMVFLEEVNSGKAEMHAGTLMPYEIIHRIVRSSGEDETKSWDTLWTQLPKPTKQKNVLVVRDGSGSMQWATLSGNLTAMDVGDSLTLYMAENNTGVYKDTFVTFSSHPDLVNLSDSVKLKNVSERLRYRSNSVELKNVSEKLRYLRKNFCDCSNTNLEAVFNLVLDTVLKNNVPQEEIPDILIISDMEFDGATTSYDQTDTLMESIRKTWDRKGFKLPKLIFWNVASRTGAIPMRENDNGVTLVSGFSTSIANMVLDKELDPWKALLKVLLVERYDAAKTILEKASEKSDCSIHDLICEPS